VAIVPTSGRQMLQRDKRSRSGDRRKVCPSFFNSAACRERKLPLAGIAEALGDSSWLPDADLDASGSESGGGGIRSLGTRVRNVGGERRLEPRVDLAQL
jgi:hypothetical protein